MFPIETPDLGNPTFTATGYPTADQPDATSTTTTAPGNTGFNPGPDITERMASSVDRFFRVRDMVFRSLRCGCVGIVESFNPYPTPTVTVFLAITETTQLNVNGPGTVGQPANINLQQQQIVPGKVLTDVPVKFVRGGGWNITLPIQQGDECWLDFSDTDFTAWFQNGGTQPQIKQRRHDLSDAVAWFGLASTPNGLDNWNLDGMELRNDDGTVLITLTDGGVKVTTNSGTFEVDALTGIMKFSGALTIQAQQVNITGQNGIVLDGGTIGTSIDGRIFRTHEHNGVQTGGSVSGPVV